jgi:phosphoribosylformylglycinamidine synthase
VVVEIPGARLVDDAPVYQPDAAEDPALPALRALHPGAAALAPLEALRRLLDTPAVASKRWVYEQYDSTVQASTIIGPGGDAALVRVPETRFALALTTDCNSRHVYLDPFEGGKAAVAEAARNVACTGARPIGITNCLNFGSPERPAVFHQFREACRGISEACRALETPVTGGNVSFYNESPSAAVYPTPVIGMVGLLEDATHAVGSHFRATGDVIVLLGETRGHLGGSSYWTHVLDTVAGAPPPVDLAAERRLVDLLVDGARRSLWRSAHDLADGGLAVALAEAAIGAPYASAPRGVTVDLRELAPAVDATGILFGEDHGRALVSAAPSSRGALLALAAAHGVPAQVIGTVGGEHARFDVVLRDAALRASSGELRELYYTAIPRRMDLVAAQDAAD